MRGGRKKLISFLLVFIILLGLLPKNAAYADGDISSEVVTDLQVSSTDIQDGGKTEVRVDFAENSSHDIKEGDTITISWTRHPDIQFSGFVNELDLEIQGKNVGKVVIRQDKAVITFNEKINNLDNVEGFVSFEIEGRNFAQTSNEDIKSGTIKSGDKTAVVNVTKPQSGVVSVFYYKTGNMDTEDTEHVNWWLNANMPKAYVDRDIRIEDEIQGGQELVKDSFQITVTGSSGGEYSNIQDFENRYDGSNIIINQNKIRVEIPQKWASLNQFSIYYQTKITESKQEKFSNNSKAWYQEHGKDAVEGENFDWSVDNINANMGIKGNAKGELKIVKKIEGTDIPIRGVKFQLKNDYETEIKDGKSEFILETDEYGVASIKGLPVGNYKVKEVEAPKWIDFDPLTARELTFEIKDEDIEGKLLNIENKIAKINVSVEKKWEDVTGEYPIIKIQLLKDGQNEGIPVELTNGMTAYTWENLDKADGQGNEYIYTVKEIGETDNIIKLGENQYNVTYSGDMKEGITITNRKEAPLLPTTPKPDNPESDNPRPKSYSPTSKTDNPKSDNPTPKLYSPAPKPGSPKFKSDNPTPKPDTQVPNAPEILNVNVNRTLPKTGDISNLFLYLLLMSASIILLTVIGYRRRKHVNR